MTAQTTETAKVFDQEQLEVLTASAVERETAALAAEKAELTTKVEELVASNEVLTAEKASLETRIDVLEAEKAAAVKAAEDAQAAFDAHKAAEIEKAAAEVRKTERIEAIKAALGDTVSDEYFTDERVARFAEMSQEAFDATLSDLTAVAEKAAAKSEAVDNIDVDKAARETAAFKGGTTPTSAEATLGGYFKATGFLPASN